MHHATLSHRTLVLATLIRTPLPHNAHAAENLRSEREAVASTVLRVVFKEEALEVLF